MGMAELVPITIAEFSGGQVGIPIDRMDPNQAEIVENFFVDEGVLRSNPGRVALAVLVPDEPVRAMCSVYMGGARHLMAVCGDYLWLDVGSYDFRPILKRTGTSTEPVTIAQYGRYVYICWESDTPVTYRFDSTFYATGKVTVAESGGHVWTVTAQDGADFEDLIDASAAVRVGDRIVYKHPTAGTWTDALGGILKSVASGGATAVIYGDTNCVATGAVEVDYVISRLTQLSMPQPPTPTLANGGGPGANMMVDGTYKYYLTYKSVTGQRSVRSLESDPITLNNNIGPYGNSVDVSGWAVFPGSGDDQYNQVEEIEIWRTPVNGEGAPEAYLITAMGRNADGTFTATYHDAQGDNDWPLDVESIPIGNDPIPSEMRAIFTGSNRVIGLNDADKLYASELANPEYWQQLDPDQDSPLEQDISQRSGFVLGLGSTDDPLVAAVVEGVGWASTGIVGSSILALRQSGAQRVTGRYYQEIRTTPLMADGLVGRNAAAQYLGTTFYLSPDGPSAIAAGSATTTPIWEILFPPIGGGFSSVVEASVLTTSLAGIWKHFALFSWPSLGAAANDRLALFHIPTASWVYMGTAHERIAGETGEGIQTIGATVMQVLLGAGSTGELILGDSANGTIYRMFESVGGKCYHGDEAGIVCRYRSGLLGTGKGKYGVQKVSQIVICTSTPVVEDQEMTIRLYAPDSTNVFEKTVLIPQGLEARTYLEAFPAFRGRKVQIEIECFFTEPMMVCWMELWPEVAPTARGQKLG
jgi:hypothetical protein